MEDELRRRGLQRLLLLVGVLVLFPAGIVLGILAMHGMQAGIAVRAGAAQSLPTATAVSKARPSPTPDLTTTAVERSASSFVALAQDVAPTISMAVVATARACSQADTTCLQAYADNLLIVRQQLERLQATSPPRQCQQLWQLMMNFVHATTEYFGAVHTAIINYSTDQSAFLSFTSPYLREVAQAKTALRAALEQGSCTT